MPVAATISQLNSTSEKFKTFIIEGEGHTLGNALTSIITTYKDVKFCGYSINHPSEVKIVLRIEVFKGTAIDALKQGLRDLMDLCDHTLDTFEKEVTEYKKDDL